MLVIAVLDNETLTVIHYTGEVADAMADYALSSFSSLGSALFGSGENVDHSRAESTVTSSAGGTGSAAVQEHNVKIKVGVDKVELLEYPKQSGIELYQPEEAIARARSRLGEKEYGLFKNNCECFVNWAITGRAVSNQSDKGKWAAGIGALFGAAAGYKKSGFSGLAMGAFAGAQQNYQNYRENRP